MVGHHAAVHVHAETVGERVETAGVFGGHDVGAFQERNEACGGVGRVADRRGSHHHRALRNVGSAHEGVKPRTRLFCSRLFRRCRRFCHLRRIHHSRSSRYFCRIRTQLIQFQVQRLIHAFHAFSLSNAKENSPPRVLNPQSLEQSGHKTDPQRGDSPTHWNNHPAYSPSNVPKHPDIGTIRTPTGLKTS